MITEFQKKEAHLIDMEDLVSTLAKLANVTLKVYSNEALAELLGIGERTLRKYREEGRISYSRVGDKIFYSDDDVRSFLLENHVDAFHYGKESMP